jgi:hypothetical protein
MVRCCRIVTFVAMWAVYTNGGAVLLQIDTKGSVLASQSHWLLPTPLPNSFAVSMVVDTQLYSSRHLAFADYGTGTGRRLDQYAFSGVAVSSISVRADNTLLWSDPAGLTLGFGGSNPSSPAGLGGYFAGAGGMNSMNQSFLISYDTFPGLTEGQTNKGDDPLANILLQLGASGFAGSSTVIVTGAWGRLQGESHEIQVSVPEPTVLWLLTLGLVAVGFTSAQHWVQPHRR